MNNNLFQNNLNENDCVLSINTTGINRQKNKIFLVNIITGGTNGILKQFFLNENNDNKIILEDIYSLLENKNIYTFNGISFDIPFLNKYFLDNSITTLNDNIYDMYLFLKNYNFLKLNNYKIKDIYEIFTNKKYEIINISDTKKNYKEYIKNKDENLLKSILNEGKLSVIYRLEILNAIYNILENKSIKFNIYDLDFKVTPYAYKITKNFINISLYNVNKDYCELLLVSKYFKIKTNDNFIELKYQITNGLIDSFTNATCIIYTDLFDINKEYPLIKENLIPILINDEINIELLNSVVIDSLVNIKSYTV